LPKYLIRRRNQFGHYLHLATWGIEPTESLIRHAFGPGEFTVLIAQEGIVGLNKFKDFMIPWEIEPLGWTSGMPTGDYIRDNYGEGNYYVLTNCRATPFQIFAVDQPHDITWQHLQDGASAMRNVSVIFRVNMPWI
jgi:hypothetical protein